MMVPELSSTKSELSGENEYDEVVYTFAFDSVRLRLPKMRLRGAHVMFLQKFRITRRRASKRIDLIPEEFPERCIWSNPKRMSGQSLQKVLDKFPKPILAGAVG